MTLYEKLAKLHDALIEIVYEIGLDYDFDVDEFTTDVETNLSREILCGIDTLKADLDYYFGCH